jgi:hypothetical protein
MHLPPLGEAVTEAAVQGYAHVPAALTSADREVLLAEVRSMPFVPVPGLVGRVRQQVEEFPASVGDPRLPAMAELAEALVRRLAPTGAFVVGLRGYRPREVTYQRYSGSTAGISPHRDFKQHRLLVAIFTLAGRAPFRIVADREGSEVLSGWEARAGDLCLLRGPGLDGNPDGRPLHAVGPPVEGERVSLAFRMTGTDTYRLVDLE